MLGERLLLREKGLPFEFVPGITSAIAVPEYAGIPVTHRKVAASFAVITGHEDPTRPHSGINWKGLATGVDTLIFLMGVENLKNITARLVENGRPADTPAALVRWGTHPEQRTLVTTLGNAYDDVQKAQLKPPAIFIVGNVVRLRDQLNWFETKPLFGKTFVVTRARAQASSLTKRLEEEGAAVLEVPAIRITDPEDYAPLDNAIDHLAQYRWVLFTSANGVDRFFERLAAHGKDARAFAPCKIGAIGSATADTLDAYGIRADLVPATYKAEDLTEALLPLLQKGDKVLLARAARARNVLPDALRAAGAGVDVVAGHHGHQRHRRVHIGVQREELEDGVQNLGHRVAVQADQLAVLGHRGRREVAVADHQRVAVTHFHHDLQKLGSQNAGNTL